MPVIGFLHSQSPDGFTDQLRGFRQGLTRARTSRLNTAGPRNQIDRLPTLAADLVRRQVAVITVFGSATAVVNKAATASIPIVFNIGDELV